jgi:hypothetical protein
MTKLTEMLKRHMDSPQMMVNLIMVSTHPDQWYNRGGWRKLEDALNQLSYRWLLWIFVQNIKKALL